MSVESNFRDRFSFALIRFKLAKNSRARSKTAKTNRDLFARVFPRLADSPLGANNMNLLRIMNGSLGCLHLL